MFILLLNSFLTCVCVARSSLLSHFCEGVDSYVGYGYDENEYESRALATTEAKGRLLMTQYSDRNCGGTIYHEAQLNIGICADPGEMKSFASPSGSINNEEDDDFQDYPRGYFFGSNVGNVFPNGTLLPVIDIIT